MKSLHALLIAACSALNCFHTAFAVPLTTTSSSSTARSSSSGTIKTSTQLSPSTSIIVVPTTTTSAKVSAVTTSKSSTRTTTSVSRSTTSRSSAATTSKSSKHTTTSVSRSTTSRSSAATTSKSSKHTTTSVSRSTTTRSATATTSASPVTTSAVAACSSGPYSASDGTGYTVQCDYNYYGGGDNIMADQTGVTSLADCIELCNGQLGCVAVDWYQSPQGSGSTQVAGNCFLLSDTSPGGGATTGIDAALKLTDADNTCQSGTQTASDGTVYTVQCDYNYAGGSNILADISGVNSLPACLDACQGQQGCTAVDWYAESQGSGPNQVAGNCFLLSDTSNGGGSLNGVNAATKSSNIDTTCASGSQMASDGTVYTVQCGYNYAGGSNILAGKSGVMSLLACLDLCDNQVGCNAVDFYATSQGSSQNQVAGNCFLLTNDAAGGGSANGVNAAIKNDVLSTSTTTQVSTTAISSSSTISSTTTSTISSTTTSTISSTTTSTISSTTTSTISSTTTSIISSTTTSSSASTPSNNTAICNPGSYTASDGATYSVQCGYNYNGGGAVLTYITTINDVGSPNACAEQCENYQGSPGCAAADYYEANQQCLLLTGTGNGGDVANGIDAVVQQTPAVIYTQKGSCDTCGWNYDQKITTNYTQLTDENNAISYCQGQCTGITGQASCDFVFVQFNYVGSSSQSWNCWINLYPYQYSLSDESTNHDPNESNMAVWFINNRQPSNGSLSSSSR